MNENLIASGIIRMLDEKPLPASYIDRLRNARSLALVAHSKKSSYFDIFSNFNFYKVAGGFALLMMTANIALNQSSDTFISDSSNMVASAYDYSTVTPLIDLAISELNSESIE